MMLPSGGGGPLPLHRVAVPPSLPGRPEPGGGKLPADYRPASDRTVPPGRSCASCLYFDEGWCALWDAGCDPDYYCDSWLPDPMAKHLRGRHDQRSHGRGRGATIPTVPARELVGRIVKKPEEMRGISINVAGREPTSGWMVAVKGHESKVSEARFKRDGQRIMRDYLRSVRKKLRGDEKLYLGVWFNTKDRTYYLDVSQQVSSKREAVRLGRERRELAVWDVKAGEEIPTTRPPDS